MIAVVSGLQFDVIDHSINIDSTPLDSADASGEVGSFTLTLLRPEFVLPDSLENFVDEEVEVIDGDRSFLGGVVSNVTETDHATLVLTGELALGAFNIRNVIMPPYAGSLEGLINLYLGTRLKAGSNITVDPAIASREMVVPGWKGELWLHVKMLCAAQSVEFIYPSTGEAVLRPVRHIEGRTLTSTDINRDTSATDLAQYVEVKEYNSVWVENQIFYPPGGWSEDTQILSLNAGETVEFNLELNGSVESVQPLTMVTYVAKDKVNESVFAIVGDDGFPIEPQMWTDFGGHVDLEVGDDSRHLILTVTAPEGLPKDNGEEIQSFAIAMASGDSSPRYSSLRIVGTGVWFDNDEPVRFPTGVAAADNQEFELGEEVGVTIDNPFLSTRALVATAVYRAAKKYVGYNSTIGGTVQRLSDAATFMEDAGARTFYDTRPYRVRSTTYTPGGVQFTAEDDLTVGDMDTALAGLTFGQVQAAFAGLTYKEVLIKGYKL